MRATAHALCAVPGTGEGLGAGSCTCGLRDGGVLPNGSQQAPLRWVCYCAHAAAVQAEQGVHARRQLSGAEAHIADLEGRVAALRAAKADLEAQVSGMEGRGGANQLPSSKHLVCCAVRCV